MSVINDPKVIARLLREAQVWAVVGLSNNQSRDAYRIAQLLKQKGKRVIPVHPSAGVVHGEQGYTSLLEAQEAIGHIDVVDVFVNSDLAGPVADEAIVIGADAVWFQLGVIDTSAADRVIEHEMDMVMDRCPAIEWPRILT
ncbi:MAG: CoA-binding protein [Actinomycetota bacterium]|nr:CoA-binding protein [Actinomycetota bacterium]